MTTLKGQLASGTPHFGLWLALSNAYTAEICAGSGRDWVLIDGEHGPNTLATVAAQVGVLRAHAVDVVCRPPSRDPTTIKQYLDVGVRNLVVPMVDSVEQASEVVAATRFPPAGIRGVASSFTRASDFGRSSDYLEVAHEELSVFVQVESATAVESAGGMADVPGVDGIFVGPADLAASLGHIGNPSHPIVQEAIQRVLKIAQSAGVFTGIFANSPEDGRYWADQGANLIAVGSDVGVLRSGVQGLFAETRGLRRCP